MAEIQPSNLIALLIRFDRHFSLDLCKPDDSLNYKLSRMNSMTHDSYTEV